MKLDIAKRAGHWARSLSLSVALPPATWVEKLHWARCKVWTQVGSVAAAREAAAAGMDAIVAQGSEAGGHNKSSAGLMALLPAVKAKIALLDPSQAVTKVRTIEQVIERSAGPQRLAAQLLTVFAAAALLLAALGIYGVVSYAVSRREREIGVRMALGAQAGDVLRMVLGEGLRLSVVGVLAGILAALALARLLAGFLYGVSPRDPLTYLVVAGGLIAAAAAATFLPARRATRVDPAVALRAE